MKNMLMLCAIGALLVTAVGCQHHQKNSNQYLVGPACGEGDCNTGAPGCDACGAGPCKGCKGRGSRMCNACRGDGCQACGGLGGHACDACGGAGSQHGAHCAQRHQAKQDRHAWRHQPNNGGPQSASVAYPYYTNRGPRDYFANPPRSIGP